MKTKSSLFYLWSFILALALSPEPSALSQIPQGFNYQAIARDGTGAVMANQTLTTVEFSIESLPSGGTVFWKEVHNSVPTNSFGLFNLVVGLGSKVGGTLASFDLIDWSIGTKYINTWINGTPMGSSQLYAVPYAMTAKNLTGTTKLGINGTTANLDEALFEVKNKDGQTIFAVYNEGVRIYVADGAKGLKGGFAVGGFGTDKATSRHYLMVSPDSVRINIDDNDTKGLKSGFAVGGYDDTKGWTQKLLTVSNDSVRIYVDNAKTDKGLKGGFAVGGYDASKGVPIKPLFIINEDSARIYLDETPSKTVKGGFAVGGYDVTKGGEPTTFTSLTPDNYFIGHQSGVFTTGLYNSYLGYQTGIVKSTGERNVFVGYQSGMGNTNGSYNVFLGNLTGYQNQGNYNTFIGYQSGYMNTTGMSNVFIGMTSGANNTEGNSNVFLGVSSGSANKKGSSNVFVGTASGNNNTDGGDNVFLGLYSGARNLTGNSNVFMGSESGFNNTTGGNNVFIGTYSGHSNKTGYSNVIIGYLSGYSGEDVKSNVFLGDSAGYGNNNDFNVFLGKSAGRVNLGRYNTFIGHQSGMKNAEGADNVFIGNKSGFNNISGGNNILIGFETGYNVNQSFNTMIGYQAGKNFTSGQQNTFIGYQAGYAFYQPGTGTANVAIGVQSGARLTSGNDNVFLGNSAGLKATTGSENIVIGKEAGNELLTGFQNVFIGKRAGYSVTTGNSNVAVGYLAGNGITTADRNTVVGESSGEKLASGITNAFYGTYSGHESTSGSGNTFIGYDCGFTNITGNFNTYLGFMAGRNALSDSSVFLGYQAGYGESLHQRLYIANGPGTPLIWGDFRHQKAAVNGKFGIYTTNPQYSVEAWGTNASLIAHYSGQARGGISALTGARVAMLSTANSDDLVFGYSSTTPMAEFSTNFVERMRIDNGTGNVGIGNTAATYKFDVTGTARTTADTYLATTSGNVAIGGVSSTQKLTVNGSTYITGDLMIGGNTYDYAPLNVEKWDGLCAYFNRRSTDGQIIQFAKTGVEVGNISVAAGVVTYNAFTGSHYGVTSDDIEEGKLVIMNGSNAWLHGQEGLEILYGISESTMANDPAAMGAYLGILEPSKPFDNNNPYLIMAEGNGEMWVVENGENLKPGDMLISSDVKGHAMKDQGQFSESYVIAKVAEPVDWNTIDETVNGLKHKKVSVLFTSFVRNNSLSAGTAEVEELKAKVERLEKLVEQLTKEK